MKLSRSPAAEPPRPLLGRGVYDLPILSEQGNPLFLLIDQDSHCVGRARELLPDMDRAQFIDALHAELDRERPTWTPTIVED